jgi:selenocysteine lyase/cysteine desulfurase
LNFTASQLASYYSRFRVGDRLLLTGHSHQAWPDVAFDAQQQAWLDAAQFVDDKWERAAQIADDVRAGWRRLLNDHDGEIALGQNTHELVVRLLSAVLLPRRTLVTTDGEFHTIRRQLDRLAEAGVRVVKIPARPVETLAERVAAAVDDRVACVLMSSVLFETAEIVADLSHVANSCDRAGATLLIDAYHHLNVVPFDIHAMGLGRAFVVGGGYKYCQLGEGNCFLRTPAGSRLRPVITGWFSEFDQLDGAARTDVVPYGAGGARFAGATYDPTSHYRAVAVFRFHREMALTAERLRAISQHQTGLIDRLLRECDLPPTIAMVLDVPPERRAGFIAVRTPDAPAVVQTLRAQQMYVDSRGDLLRIGPAPYVSDNQLESATRLLAAALENPKL